MALPTPLLDLYRSKLKTPEAALAAVASGDTVFLHGMAATPHTLIDALVARHAALKDITLYCLHMDGEAAFTKPEYSGSFFTRALFVSPNLRKAVAEGRADYVPIFLSETPLLFRTRRVQVDVALVHVSEPDSHGYCSLGTSVDCTNAVVDTARKVIAQVNPRMPRTHGDAHIHLSRIDALVEVDTPLPQLETPPPTELELAIGRNVASLIDDYATLQMGIGAIPNAVLAALTGHKGLGVHTEMFSDGVVPLVESGVITGERKKFGHEKIAATFVIGTQRLFDFLHDNLMVEMLDVAITNNTNVIAQNDKVAAINSAIEVDLTGQICADSIGTYQYSGVGGQMDFMRGAARSEGGKPIIALPSVTSKNESRIVCTLKPGASVTTTRSHVHYVVTEYGVAELYGKTLRERAKALIGIAHPDHREALSREAFDRFKNL
ncbi:MAG: acetyl-CoA hydrolase/transferase C-terminal domain-containing protein [Bacteroidia bacterium]|nr:acetyl-CoA hydrolase/transferase C-terminal domain-containing protein [Bacteroidia bacterium]